ncbi:methionine synthase [Pseudomonadota bacterium]|jgi:5-methyltetrahydropteroyltriglutamate--homocysteine methyltransferase|nr:methionine synthase [Alphaproteobacteria bacterium]MDC1356221.1 methionine synthase [Pseudomonadota bacterium]
MNINTTISGSLPKPSWLAEGEKIWAPWKLSGEELLEAKADALKIAVSDQDLAGISIICDGEQTRQHFVTTFIEGLSGVNFQDKKTVKIRDRYDAEVPIIFEKVHRKKPVFLNDAKLLRSLTKKPIKYTLPGPMTMIDTLYDNFYGSREKLAFEFAEILNEEAKELCDAGVDIIQFDEPAFNVFFDDVKNWGISALERACEGLNKTAVHICYGYGIEANIKWKNTLGNEWRQYENIFPALANSSINQVSLECINSKVPIELISLLNNKEVMIGVIDVASNEIETPDNINQVLKNASNYIDKKNIIACTNCGLVPLKRKVARQKLSALVEGAKIFSES